MIELTSWPNSTQSGIFPSGLSKIILTKLGIGLLLSSKILGMLKIISLLYCSTGISEIWKGALNIVSPFEEALYWETIISLSLKIVCGTVVFNSNIVVKVGRSASSSKLKSSCWTPSIIILLLLSKEVILTKEFWNWGKEIKWYFFP